ncbi:MAG: hypothetical protein GC156_01785 [Actinomycetales bacterium]|nr:hypothetical protein [Actinomycetales bacterium]
MPADVPPPVAEAIGRLTAPDPSDAAPPRKVTGALAELWSWWHTVMPAGDLQVAWVPAPTGAAAEALAAGVAAAETAIDSGATLLVPRIEPRDEVAARAIIALLSRREASAVLGQPEGMADRDWMAACAAIRDRAASAAEFRGEPVHLLSHLDAGPLAGCVGILLASASRRTPCLIDGTDELAAALIADRLAHRAKAWWRSASTSTDPGRAAAIDRIDLAPGLPLDLSDDDALGAEVTESVLRLLTLAP